MKSLTFIFFLHLFKTAHAILPDFALHHKDPEYLIQHQSVASTAQPANQYEFIINKVTFVLIKKDITTLPIDAIVNAANKYLLPGGGVCGAIFEAAQGKTHALEEYIKTHFPKGIEPGEAVITPSFNLEANYGIKFIVHAVGPIYSAYSDKKQAQQILINCYQEAFRSAGEYKENESIAFPFISSGIYGFPKQEAAEIAIKTIINETQRKHHFIKKVYFVFTHQEDLELFKKIFEIKQTILK